MNNSDAATLFLTSILIVFLSSCGNGTLQSRKQNQNILAGTIDPFDFGDEFIHKTEINGNKETTGKTPDTNISNNTSKPDTQSSLPRSSTQPEDRTITLNSGSIATKLVYRIQIGSFENKANAERLAQRAESNIDLPVYIEYKTPFYRVNLGDFTDKREAEKYVKLLRDKGFKDARWIPTEINNSVGKETR